MSLLYYPVLSREMETVGSIYICLPLYLLLLSCSFVSDSLPPLGLCFAGSSVHGIFQVRILELVTISYSREPSWPKDWTHVSCISCIGRFFTIAPRGNSHLSIYLYVKELAHISMQADMPKFYSLFRSKTPNDVVLLRTMRASQKHSE